MSLPADGLYRGNLIVGVCCACGKAVYRSRAAAAKHARYILRAKDDRLEPYFCRAGGWHLGHRRYRRDRIGKLRELRELRAQRRERVQS